MSTEVNWREYIHSDPKILVGKPVIRGTRLAVDFILGLFAAGWTTEQVLESYPTLTAQALQAVFAFAADIISKSTQEGWSKWVKVAIKVAMLVGIVALIALCFVRWITTGQFVAVSCIWLATWIIFFPPPEISKIAVGILTIERNVQAAQEIRDQAQKIKNQVEELAGEVRAATGRIETAQEQIDAHQAEIAKVHKSSREIEENLRRMTADLGGVVEALVEVTHLTIQTRGKYPIPEPVMKWIKQGLDQLAQYARPDPADRKKWFEDMDATLKKP